MYASGSVALALLELMVHVRNDRVLDHYLMFQLTLDSADIRCLSASQLPDDWRAGPAPASTAVIGDKWLKRAGDLALAVPSVVAPGEYVYVLNPDHPDWQRVLGTAEEVAFDGDPRYR